MEPQRHPLNESFEWSAVPGPFRRITVEQARTYNEQGYFVLENGCPWVVPGLRRHGTLRHWMTDLGWRCLEHPDTAVPTPARAGSIVVFSSLTPHRTGPNLTDNVRKAYIVQFAPDGARTIRVDEHAGARREDLCNDPHWQFPVLMDGRPV
jgi:ectoine hydroxylase-related dioxygenase (phytanoyl-CoA dioxygenase family)